MAAGGVNLEAIGGPFDGHKQPIDVTPTPKKIKIAKCVDCKCVHAFLLNGANTPVNAPLYRLDEEGSDEARLRYVIADLTLPPAQRSAKEKEPVAA